MTMYVAAIQGTASTPHPFTTVGISFCPKV